MYDALNAAVIHLEGNVQSTQTLLEAKVRELEDEGPKFEQLEKDFQQTNEEYDAKKKKIVSLKNKKSSLEDTIKRLKMDKEKMAAPVAELREELKKTKQELLELMKSQGQKTSGIEQQIYVEGFKLRTVLEENLKFEENCRNLERDLSDLQEQLESNDQIKNALNQELMAVKDLLFNSWRDDTDMQNMFAARDTRMVEAFEELLGQTLRREEKIEDVAQRLQGELEILSGFLENVSTRRPRDSRGSSRKQSGRTGSRPGSRKDAVEAVAAANQGSVSQAPTPSRRSTPGEPRTPHSPRPSTRNPHSARSLARTRSAKSVTISTTSSPRKEVLL